MSFFNVIWMRDICLLVRLLYKDLQTLLRVFGGEIIQFILICNIRAMCNYNILLDNTLEMSIKIRQRVIGLLLYRHK